jgi:hypothetical protein
LTPFPEGAALTEVFGWMCLVTNGVSLLQTKK